MRIANGFKVKKNSDGTYSASARCLGRPMVAEGRTIGSASVALLKMAQNRVLEVQRENASVH